MKKVIIFFLATVLILAGGGAAYLLSFLTKRPSPEGEDVVFEVKAGPLKIVAAELEKKGLITDAEKFSFLAKVTAMAGKVRVGEYALRTDMLPHEVLSRIVSGKSIIHSFTVPEGSNLWDIALTLEQKNLAPKGEFLSLVRDRTFIESLLGEPLDSLEGYLYPDTYGVTRYTGTKKIIEQMVKRFLDEYAKIKADAERVGWARNQVVTLASIVEKETGAAQERPLISSVFHNRIKKGMRLQTDPTVIYGILAETGTLPNNITKKDLLTPTKYNTYTNFGLPPGPISNPGLASLRAAIRPAETEYLFFVSHNDGTHEFTKNLNDHNNAVLKFQKNVKAREGKSWRDLNKSANR